MTGLENVWDSKRRKKSYLKIQTSMNVALDLTNYLEIKKNVKKFVKVRQEVLFEDFLTGALRDAKNWVSSYLSNPILSIIASSIVWNQGGNTFIVQNNHLIDCWGHDYNIDENIPIQVAHPMEMEKEELDGWKKFLKANQIEQPFTQIWEPVIDLDSIEADRYRNYPIPLYRFKEQNKSGIFIKFENNWNIDILFKDCLNTLKRLDWHEGIEQSINDRFVIEGCAVETKSRYANHIISYLDRITMYGRVENNDMRIITFLDEFTLEQILEYIDLAIEKDSKNCLAVLMEYKNKTYSSCDPINEFTLA